MKYNIENLSTEELLSLYSDILKQLKVRDVIRSKNLLGDLGEYLAIEYYCKTPNLPKLQSAPIGTKNIDAISIKGQRYSIKSTSSRLTGVFRGLSGPESDEPDEKHFEYVIIVIFDDDFKLNKILEINWEQFLKFKRWHPTVKAWNIPITKALIKDSKNIMNY